MGSHSGSGRRRFLTSGGALAAFVMGAVKSVRGQTAAPTYEPQGLLAYGQPSKFASSVVRRTTGRPTALTDTAPMTPLQELDGIITPSGLHFLMDHTNGIPDVDPQKHRLMVHGMVDRPLTYTLEEIRRFPSVSRSTSSSATPTAVRCAVRTASRSSSYTDARAAANGPACCCPCCSGRAAFSPRRAGSWPKAASRTGSSLDRRRSSRGRPAA